MNSSFTKMVKRDQLLEILWEHWLWICIKNKEQLKIIYHLTNWVEWNKQWHKVIAFNICIEDIFKNILWNEEGRSAGRQGLTCVKFADNMIIMVDDTKVLKRMIPIKNWERRWKNIELSYLTSYETKVISKNKKNRTCW